MTDINREELAWAAGFFDGEGNCRAQLHSYKGIKGRYCSPRMRVFQKDTRVLERWGKAIGNLGAVKGPYGPHDMFSYEVFGFERVQAIIAMLFSFLSPVKQQQCLETLKTYREWYAQHPHKEGYLLRKRSK